MVTSGKQKVNVCFICNKTANTEEHHVKELDSEYTIEVCHDCYTVITKYYEEAIPNLTKFRDEKNKKSESYTIKEEKIMDEIKKLDDEITGFSDT